MFLLFYNLIGIELFLQVFLPPLYIYVALFLLSFSIFLSSPSFLCPPLRWCYRRSGERLVCIRECDASAYTTCWLMVTVMAWLCWLFILSSLSYLCIVSITTSSVMMQLISFFFVIVISPSRCYIFWPLSCLSLLVWDIYTRVLHEKIVPYCSVVFYSVEKHNKAYS